jgi:structure-specific endonuclease subunit SLX1
LSSTFEKVCSLKSRKRGVTTGHGIAALPLTYIPQKKHVEKSKAIIDFEREGSCSICSQDLIHDGGIYAICPHPGCESVSHLTCLSKSFLEGESGQRSNNGESNNTDQDPALVPIAGKCKGCGGTLKWVDVVKEVTLRMRGVEEVEKLLKEPRKKALKKPTPRKRKPKSVDTATSAITSSDTDEWLDDDDGDGTAEEQDAPKEDPLGDERENFDIAKDNAPFSMRDGPYDRQNEWLVIDDSDDGDLRSVTGTLHASPDRVERARRMAMDLIIEDSDWLDVPVLD